MWVEYKGKAKVLLTDYNGKRYAFYKGKPVEISHEIYNSMIVSRHVNTTELVPVEAKNIVIESPKIDVSEGEPKRIKKIKVKVKKK